MHATNADAALAPGAEPRLDPVALHHDDADGLQTDVPEHGGALYGPPSHGMTSPLYRAPARSKVPGIFLAGGSAHPARGVPMVARSGMLAAEGVLASSLRP